MNIEPVAYFSSPLKEKFGIPRQSGLATCLRGEVRFVPPYDAPEAVRGLEGFDYCWLLWGFSLNPEAAPSLTVRPPRLGGNKRVGVFASRSPFRPNQLGLSCVRIVSVKPGVIVVSGADLADGTPVFDVKPYVAYSDSHDGIRCGFVDCMAWSELEVEIPEEIREALGEQDCAIISQLLSQDPRPQYQDDPERIYGLSFGGYNVKFRIDGQKVLVLSV